MKFMIVEDLSVIFENLSEEYTVKEMRPREVIEWMLTNHYLHREPRAKFAFGLFKNDGTMVGACTYGMPPIALNKKFHPFPIFDLNRVSLIEHQEKNLVSWFISQTLGQFPKVPAIIISFADPNVGHAGTIYQALNFVYTGTGRKTEKYIVNGEEVPPRTMSHRYGTQSIPELKKMGVDVKVEYDAGKHRYFTFVGDKRQRKEMLKMIEKYYEIQNYPKAG